MRSGRQNSLVSNELLEKLTNYDAERLNRELLQEFPWLQEVHISTTAQQASSVLTVVMTRKSGVDENFFPQQSRLKTGIANKLKIDRNDIAVEDYAMTISTLEAALNSPLIKEIYQRVLWCKIPLAEFTYSTRDAFNAKLNENLEAKIAEMNASSEAVIDVPEIEESKLSEVEVLKMVLAEVMSKLPSIERERVQNKLEKNGIDLGQSGAVEIL